MTIFQRAMIFAAAVAAKSPNFTVYIGKQKYLVQVTTTAHTSPLGTFNFVQAGAIAAEFTLGVPFTVRIGEDDVTFAATPIS